MMRRIGYIPNETDRIYSYTDPNTGQTYSAGPDDIMRPIDPLAESYSGATYTPPVMEATKETITTENQYSPPAQLPALRMSAAADIPAEKTATPLGKILLALGIVYLLTKEK